MKKTLTFLLAFVTITPVWAQIQDTSSVASDTTIYELPSQRSYNSKTFYNSKDDTYIAHISAGAIHYEAADGSFREIDTQLRPDASGRQGVDQGLYQVRFNDRNGKGNEYDVAFVIPKPVQRKFRDPGKAPAPLTRLHWKILSLGYFDAQGKGYQVIQNARGVTPAAAGNESSYLQVFPGIDVRYTCQNAFLKEEFVLSQQARKDLPDPTRYGISRDQAYLMIAVEFDVQPASLKAFANRLEGKTDIKPGNWFGYEGDDPIDFEDEDGTRHFFFAKDYAWAAADEEQRTSVRRYFYSDKGKHYLLAGVPWNWVQSAPVGDLIIDPTTPVTANDDTRLYDASNYGSSTVLAIGKPSGTLKRRTIIKFTLPPSLNGATVLNAQLKLWYSTNSGTPVIDRWVQAHELLVSWDEMQATRDIRLTGVNWASQYGAINGTDAKAGFESTMLFKSTDPVSVWKAWNLSALTQKWINTPANNYGVILWATNEDTDGQALQFNSAEAASNKPYLEVIYSLQAKTVYFLKDHLGSIRATVQDTTGAPVRGYDDYDPWGYVLASRSMASSILPLTTRNKFTGKERDDEYGVNWDYFGARYYDAQIGRWMVRDPLAEKYPSLSPYVYTTNNPISSFDPNGAYTVRAEYLLGTVGVQASRVTIGEARTLAIAGLTGIGNFMGLAYKHSLNDPAFANSRSDYAFAALGGITSIVGKTVSMFSHGDDAVRVLDGALALTNLMLFNVDQFLFDATPLALDELTFEVADRTNVGGVDLGSVSGSQFTLSAQLAQSFATEQNPALSAQDFLETKLGSIQAAIKKIAKARGYNLSRNADREALRSYLQDEENQDEISQFMEEAQSQ